MNNEPQGTREMPTNLPWKLIEGITSDFAVEQKIGSGGYGVVYKGVHQNGQVVAVKKLHHMPGLDEDQFQNELQILARLHHPNIVQLVGKSYIERDRCVEHQGRLVFATMIDRAICLEYLPNGSLEKHLSDESSGLPWHRRYKIIKGICDGLGYLHEQRIFHLDLKPANILLDEDMVPKIADFGLSRLFSGTRQSHTTRHFLGTLGYAPPEYIEMGKITMKFDVFSLGVILIKILAGPDGYSEYSDISASQDFVGLVQGKWRKILQMAGWKDVSYLDAYCNQVKTCMEIALKCVESNRHRRPSIGDIISMLKETEATIDELYKQLFVVQPQILCFPFEPDKLISCPLHLTNEADHHIAFRLQPKTPDTFVGCLEGLVPARFTLTYILTMREQQKPPPNLDNIQIQSIVGSNFYDGTDLLYMKAQAVHDETKKMKITSFYECASLPTSQPRIEILSLKFHVMDVHPMKPWILARGTAGDIQIWNYRTKEKLDLSGLLQLTDGETTEAKFVARRQWFVAGDWNGYINVYCYKTMQQLERFEAHHEERVGCLAVHPTEPYVMSASPMDPNVKLWDWEKGWECTRIFKFFDYDVYDVTFNLMETNAFAVRGRAGIKICSFVSPGSNFILDEYEHEDIWCFHYFANGRQRYLITGGFHATVKIWDLHTKSLVKTVEGEYLRSVSAVCSHPELAILVTGSLRGIVCLWNPITLRPERIFNFGLGGVKAVNLCMDGSRSYRVVLGCTSGLAMIENERKEPEDDQVVPDLNVSTEQEVPGIGDGNGPLPDLNVCFTGEVPALRHSPRIQKQYDGVRITSSDRATRRKEVANGDTVSISSQGSESSRGKRHKKKRLDVADLVQLPLKKKPAPTTKAKIKKVGRMLWN